MERLAVEKHYGKNENIFNAGDQAEYVWFIKEGHVKSVHHNSTGRCQTLCLTGAKGMFGSCCAFGAESYPCHSVAESETSVIKVPLDAFMDLLGRQPEMGLALTRILSQRLRESKNAKTFEQEPVEKRVIHVLLGLVKEFGKIVPLTRRDIAEMAGTTVETSIRTFLKFENDGLVATARGKIIIKNMQLLEERLNVA